MKMFITLSKPICLPGFKGPITVTDNDQRRIVVSGVLSNTCLGQLEITELPIGVWTQEYKTSVLDPLWRSKRISGYNEYHTGSTVRFIVHLSKEQMLEAEAEGLYPLFQLKRTLNHKSLPVVDSEGNLHIYDQLAILKNFFSVRLDLYTKRKDYLAGLLKAECRRLVYQARFIVEVRQGTIAPVYNNVIISFMQSD